MMTDFKIELFFSSQMATLTEGMYFQFQRLLEERDEYLEVISFFHLHFDPLI